MTMAHTASSQTQQDQTGTDIHAEPVGHGNSPAAWTCVLIMMVGAIVAAVAFIVANSPIFWGGIGIIIIGLIVGWIMRKVGYGVGGSKLNKGGH
jgi:fatty acid desaturase